jgi:uncharacterized Zn-binding protein involved in type VI secretion
MGDMCVCVGPPDTIVLGSTGVMIGGKPAARMGDQCAHGGKIVVGCPTVMIGESGGGGGGGGGALSVIDSVIENEGLSAMSHHVLAKVLDSMPPDVKEEMAQIMAMKNAAIDGVALAHDVDKHDKLTCPICSKKQTKCL